MTRKTKIIIGVVVVVVLIAIVAFARRGEETTVRTVTVESRAVTQEVTFTGRLEAVQAADLGFQTGGLISSIPIRVGQTVSQGDLLMQLDARSASLERSKAFADRVSTQQTTYITWQNAEQEWDNTKKANALSVDKQKQTVRDAKAEMDQAEIAWQASADENGDESAAAQAAYSAFVTKRSIYNAAQKTLNELLQTTANSTATTRAAANLAQEQHLSTKQAAGNVGGISSLTALEQLAAVQLSYASIYAPFTGVVAAIEASEGEYAAPGVVQVSITSADQLQVTSDVTEVDAAKLTIGLPVKITFDVFPTEDGLTGEVSAISPAAKIIEGVPTYEVTVNLLGSDKRLKPGFTTNVVIIADERTNVLAVPRRAVITKNNQSFVRVQGEDGFVAEHPVETGLVGSDGAVEITRGLQPGMKVIINPSLDDAEAAN